MTAHDATSICIHSCHTYTHIVWTLSIDARLKPGKAYYISQVYFSHVEYYFLSPRGTPERLTFGANISRGTWLLDNPPPQKKRLLQHNSSYAKCTHFFQRANHSLGTGYPHCQSFENMTLDELCTNKRLLLHHPSYPPHAFPRWFKLRTESTDNWCCCSINRQEPVYITQKSDSIMTEYQDLSHLLGHARRGLHQPSQGSLTISLACDST